MSAFKDKKQTFLKVLYVAGGVAILSLILLIISDSLIDFNSTKDGRYNPSIKTQLKSLRYDLFNKGIILALVLSTSFLLLYYYYYKNKILESLFSYGIIGLIILDLGVLNNEFINVKPKKNMDKMFQKNSIINHLLLILQILGFSLQMKLVQINTVTGISKALGDIDQLSYAFIKILWMQVVSIAHIF